MLMRALRFASVAVLSVLLGSAAVGYAQDEKQQDEKPARQEEPKAEPRQDEAKPPRQDDAKPGKEEKQQEDKQDMKRDQDQSRDHMKSDQQAEHARPAGKSGHIPDDKFRAHFGQSHHFSVRGVVVQGQPRFQYGGYTFEFVDAWPAGWGYTDDCYIDYIDGEYFLSDILHPGVRIALFVVL
jgi:hypothetical protein